MIAMAKVWFMVIVLFAVQEVFGAEWSSGCDQCFRRGAKWCNNKMIDSHCELSPNDDWCPDDQESLPRRNITNNPGDLISPIYAERTLTIDVPDNLEITFQPRMVKGNRQRVFISIENTTQIVEEFSIKEYETKCKGQECKSTIRAKASSDFCTDSGTTEEFVYVKVKFEGHSETVVVKYHVPCACECSKYVEKNSKHCNGNGRYSCGTCECNEFWQGPDCSKTNCPPNRGDQGCSSDYNSLTCSGNGYCSPCETCICYTDREGSQYFDERQCADPCMIMNNCDDCFTNNTLGICDSSCTIDANYIYKVEYNATEIEQRDSMNRKVWMKCNSTINECMYTYGAKRDSERNLIVMVIESCNDSIVGGQTATQQVPIILGVIVLLAVVAAVAGVMIWKHMNTLPAAPVNKPGYENIDAEDCTGENPLYKPPTTNFQNPTYGKW